jgi:hypothetical protein
VEIFVRGNIAPMHKMNGLVEIRYDGEVLMLANRAAVRLKQEDMFECFSFITYAGTFDTNSQLSKDSWVDIADITLSSKPLW